MILILIIMIVASLILTLVDAMVPTRPSWLLNAAVFIGFLAVLIWMFTGADPIQIDTD